MSVLLAGTLNRREFLTTTGACVTAAGAAPRKGISVVMDPADLVAASAPAQWAAAELGRVLADRRVPMRQLARISDAPADDFCIVGAGAVAAVAQKVLTAARVRVPDVAEALALAPARLEGRHALLACGHDAAGLVFALLELADSIRNASDPLAALSLTKPVSERPANVVRSVARLFTSDVEDKSWYNDREMWPQYLTMLAAQRFNRFNLTLGIGYDFLRNVTDGYFLFAYPFLLRVPGYDVRVPQLPDAERDGNLEMLRFISEQTLARGIQFQLGIWMHGYEWINSPRPNYSIEGLTPQTHGAYCRDAVRALLQACPAISGVTFRVHGESGVEEGSYAFWKTVFEGVATCGRRVEIDMHSKGMDQTMLDLAVATGLPVKISPKYWAEHMGMPYHQADIRELEQPKPGRTTSGLMKFSEGSRSFTRYGYADLLREDRRWGVLQRIWPGTQRLLIWGDPLTAAAHSRAFGFCGSDGVEICEPLSFKGRRGSGIAGDRCAYQDASLRPRWDWEKYAYSYRVWGRLLYNPDADPGCWRRFLSKQFGPGAAALETALANASRILPIVTTAHAPSAGNNNYWPEIYTNQSLIQPDPRGPYGDTPAPKVFGNVSPLDPQLFSRINDFADGLLDGAPDAKYSPIEAAQWIEDYAAAAAKALAAAEASAAGKDRPEYRRVAIDIAIQTGLGRFFGARFRSGVLYRIFEKTGDPSALEAALRLYRQARAAWADIVARTKDVYQKDITVGERSWLRGHWMDRLSAIDRDIEVVALKLEQAKPCKGSARVATAVAHALGRPLRPTAACRHHPPERFRAGKPLELELQAGGNFSAVILHYRHVTQAERYVSVEMQTAGGRYRASIPGIYTDSAYPLQYYFEIRKGREVWLYPGLGPDLVRQPYFVIRRSGK